MIYKPNLHLELQYNYQSTQVAGIDEAGRGPWAGPLVAAVVILNPHNIPEGINDSKKLSALQRSLLFKQITETAAFGVGIVSVEEIDLLKMTAATALAMNRALDQLNSTPSTLLLDGNLKLKLNALQIINIIKGDSISLSIAAASILAKVSRDRIMHKLSEEYPYYHWHKNVGYGTQDHIKALNTYGVCKYHRKSFAPIRKILNNN